MTTPSKHPVPDKAEFAIDLPDKFHMGSFGKEAKFVAAAENDGIMIKLFAAGGKKREAQIHLHHELLADILMEWASSLKKEPKMSDVHQENLLESLRHVEMAIVGKT
jgi:hypothetical protein